MHYEAHSITHFLLCICRFLHLLMHNKAHSIAPLCCSSFSVYIYSCTTKLTQSHLFWCSFEFRCLLQHYEAHSIAFFLMLIYKHEDIYIVLTGNSPGHPHVHSATQHSLDHHNHFLRHDTHRITTIIIGDMTLIWSPRSCSAAWHSLHHHNHA